MLKKIFTYSAITLLAAAAVAYFYLASLLYAAKSGESVCRSVEVEISDSAVNRFVSKKEVIAIVTQYDGECVGKRCDKIDLARIERLLNSRSAIKESQASLTRDGIMRIEITQRRPVLRIETFNGGFYIDESEYIFPLVESFTSYVPVVSGHIPLNLDADYRGEAAEEQMPWLTKTLELGKFLDSNPFWSAMIEQIYVEQNGDLILSPKVGKMKIIFGPPDNIEEKFRKLLAFYKNIAPQRGWERYSEVNLKYKGQIVCKINNKALKN